MHAVPPHEAACPAFCTYTLPPWTSPHNSNTHIEEEINRLRAELLRKDQEAERMQLALAAEKEERERAQVRPSGWVACWVAATEVRVCSRFWPACIFNVPPLGLLLQ